MAVEIRPVGSRRELTTFIKLPFRLYRGQPNWVPPLIYDRRRFLDRGRNPFFEHGDAEYFLARRDGRVVGRISAQIDHHLQAFQHNHWGQFGFFDCEDDQEAATALIDTAQAWVQRRGCDRIVGPFDFTTNDECGVLVEGFDRLPVILMNWTHPYYPRLLEGAGLTKAMDTLMWSLDVVNRDRVHPAIWDMAEKVESEHGIVCRGMRKNRRIDRVRVFALGVKREFQHTGVAARFYQMHYDAAERTPQHVGETGWILETNKPMNRAMEGMGGEVVARYRIFEREIPQAGATAAA